jgi:excisionase family DNA binding protein
MYEYDSDSPIISVEELMDSLKIGKNVAYQLLNQGLIRAFRIGRVWKIPKNAVEEFIISSSKGSC